jgi:uncharacterized membrane protein
MEPEQRIALLESRLAALEAHLGLRATRESDPEPPQAPLEVRTGWAAPRPAVAPTQTDQAPSKGLDIARVLGIGGVIALLLAASYLIRLALESGWLTPARQIGLAATLGVAMIATGIALLKQERRYASLLPAGGLAILYLCTYGAHFAYALISPWVAGLLVMGLSLFALPLGRTLQTDVYALLSAVTSYSVPLLLPVLKSDPLGLALYFSAWGLLYSAYSLFVRKRAVYLVALYLGLVLFAALPKPDSAWVATLLFQTLQLLVFGAAAAIFSLREGRAMTSIEAAAHAPALMIFYALQYSTLSRHVPDWAPVAAIASATALVAIYLAARRRLGDSRMASLQLVAGYAALVALHAVYLELVAEWAKPFVALVIGPLASYAAFRHASLRRDLWPLFIAALVVYAINILDQFRLLDPRPATLREAMMAGVFALQLYVAYGKVRAEMPREVMLIVLYTGHLMAMVAALSAWDSALPVAVAWALLAAATLWLGIRRGDRDLGRSALLILAFLAGKVLLHDLSDAGPVARILCLLVLGVALYGSGLVYQRKLAGGTDAGGQ